MYGKSYDGVTGLIGVDKRPQGLKAVVSQEPVYDLYRYLYGDGMRRANAFLTPALYDLIDFTPGPILDAPDYLVNGANDTPAPGLPGRQLRRPGRQRRPRLGLLEGAHADPRRQGLGRPALPHPGADREQHRRRRHGPVPPEPHRLRARVAGPVGARARQRDRRERPAQDGPRGLVRRDHALLRPLPQGRRAGRQGPAGRGPDQRRQVARRGSVAAGRRGALHDRPARRHLHRRRQRRTPRATAPRRACGRSRRRWQATPTWPAPARSPSTSARRCRTPTSWSTSTTSTPPARAR